jgi:catechol-2,3-dioxygenase
MGENTSPVLSPSHLAHVVLRTTPANYTVMTSFYKTFLGAHASYENDVIAFLTYDHEHHRVAITAVPGTVDRAGKAAGMEHFAFTFDGLNGLVKAYEQRKERGILPEWCINHGPTVSMYYRDPDGNRVECQVDVFETVEETTKFMGESFYSISLSCCSLHFLYC